MIDVFDAIFGQETYDPCEAVKVLRPAYMRLAAGQGEEEIRFRDRKTVLQRADLSVLSGLLAQMEAECAAKRGQTATRRAVTAAPYRM